MTNDAPVEWQDFESITADIMWLDKNTRLLTKTKVFNKAKGGRSLYHSEVRYYNPNSNSERVNINISLNTTCNIKQFKEINGYKSEIVMKTIHVYKLWNSLISLHELIITKYDEIFGKDNNTMVLLKRLKPIQVDCMFGGYILMEPCIIPGENPDGGIRLCLDSVDNSIFLDLDKALEMAIELKHLRLHEIGMQQIRELDSRALGYNSMNINELSGGATKKKPYFHQ